ncbi:MAG: YncE family protein [Acidimicrobiales bacterium]
MFGDRGQGKMAAVLLATGLLSLSCSSASESVSIDGDVAAAKVTTEGQSGGAASSTASGVATPADTASASTAAPTTGAPTTAAPPATAPPPLNLYAETTAGKFSAKVAGITPRVYVPNSDAHSLTVIDPATGAVLETVTVGVLPHHVTPSWDLSTLWVLDTSGNAIFPIDRARRSWVIRSRWRIPQPVLHPRWLHCAGHRRAVPAHRRPRPQHVGTAVERGRAPPGREPRRLLPDGRYFYASCEFSGWLAKIDLVEHRVVAERQIGFEPIDVKFNPDATVLYVAEQTRGGVLLIDPEDLHEIAFLPTGAGTHGLYPSRDGTKLYATNRLGGSVSVIDFATNQVIATWTIPGGGSPDMGSVSPDGSQFWVSGRYHSEVYVFDTTTGALAMRIKAGGGAHGLTYFPQPGRYSMGHTGNYR